MLGAFYLRLTGSDVDVYRYLEPLYNDYRKVRQKLADGSKFIFFVKWIKVFDWFCSLTSFIYLTRIFVDTCG